MKLATKGDVAPQDRAAVARGLDFWVMVHHHYAPMLHVWYPHGMCEAGLPVVEKETERLAHRVHEPVSLVFRDARGENLERVYVPADWNVYEGRPFAKGVKETVVLGGGMWLPVYTPLAVLPFKNDEMAFDDVLLFHEAKDELLKPLCLARRSVLVMGALDPVVREEIIAPMGRDVVVARMKKLFAQTQRSIVAPVGLEILGIARRPSRLNGLGPNVMMAIKQYRAEI